MSTIPEKFAFSCPEAHIHSKAPLTKELPEYTKVDGVAVQAYNFPCYDHAKEKYERKMDENHAKAVGLKNQLSKLSDPAAQIAAMSLADKAESADALNKSVTELMKQGSEIFEETTKDKKTFFERWGSDAERRSVRDL